MIILLKLHIPKKPSKNLKSQLENLKSDLGIADVDLESAILDEANDRRS